MTPTRKSFRVIRSGRFLALFALPAFLAFPAWSQSAEEPVIAMTFTGDELRFRLAGSGKAVIDWGDGERETVILIAGYIGIAAGSGNYEVSHSYKERAGRVNVKIGGNVTALYCIQNGVSAIDAGGSSTLEYLVCAGIGVSSLSVHGKGALRELHCFNTAINAKAAEALFGSLPDRRGEHEMGTISCGGTTACGEKAHAAARAKGWVVYH